MRQTTTLDDPARPFGERGSRIEQGHSAMAGIAVTNCGVGLVYAVFNPRCRQDLSASGFSFDYEILDQDPASDVSMTCIDQRLAQCNSYADVITGHELAEPLATLRDQANDLDRYDALSDLARRWPLRNDSSTPPARPWLIDTASDLANPYKDLEWACRAYKIRSWYLPPRTCPRLPVTAALASVVMTARKLKWRTWDLLDLDQLVSAKAHAKP